MVKARGRVLVIMNRFQGYEGLIKQALEKLGYEAAWSDARPGNSFLIKALTRLGVLQLVNSVFKSNTHRIIREAQEFGADTLLLISPENVRASEMEQLRSAMPEARVVLYLWDAFANRHVDQKMIDLADKAYSFDIDDCDRFANLRHVPLFHVHETFQKPSPSEAGYELDYCFIGTARLRRIKILSAIARKLRRDNARYYFYQFAPSVLQEFLFKLYAWRWGYDGSLSWVSIPYQIYLDRLAKSACVIDIEQERQGGLTIRTMDAVFAGRPLATTNENIARHDFFPHFPISVFSPDGHDLELPKSPNSPEAEDFFRKYRIDNWLETILTDRPANYRLLSQAGSNVTPLAEDPERREQTPPRSEQKSRQAS